MKIRIAASPSKPVASYRIRTKLIFEDLPQIHDIDWYPPNKDIDNAIVFIDKDKQRDLWPTEWPDSTIVVWDMCDWYFDRSPDLVDFLLNRVDYVTVATEYLSEKLLKTYGVQSTVIKDRYQIEPISCSWPANNDCIEVLWYGNSNNIDEDVFIERIWEPFKDFELPVNFKILTSSDFKLKECYHDEKNTLELITWQLENWQSYVKNSDFVFIPKLSDDDFNLSKGHIRVIDSIMAHSFVIADEIPAYQNYANYGRIIPHANFVAETRRALNSKSESIQRIQNGQAYIVDKYDRATLIKKWEQTLLSYENRPNH